VRRIGFVRVTVVVACALTLLTSAQGGGDPVPATPVRAGATTGEPLRIMPLGASSTVGAGSPGTAGYRGPLQELLAEDGLTVDLVGSQQDGPPTVPDRDHEGRGGWTLARMAPYVAAWVASARPDVVLLHAGTNDLIQGVSARVAAARLDAVLDAIHEVSDAHVVVAGVWAPLPERRTARAEFAERAAAVVAEHRAHGQDVSYADTGALLTRGELADGLHPNASGYRRIALMWEEQVLAAVAES
jgi:lysophospholipase L1-like esterase